MSTSALSEISEVEARYRPPRGESSLGTAFEMLEARWRDGERDRESGLRLFFLAWYSCAEPTQLTGLPQASMAPTISELLQHFGGAESEDAEFLATLAIMSEVAPWCLDHSLNSKAQSSHLLARALQLKPGGFAPEYYADRGTYGDYMQHMATIHPLLSGGRNAG